MNCTKYKKWKTVLLGGDGIFRKSFCDYPINFFLQCTDVFSWREGDILLLSLCHSFSYDTLYLKQITYVTDSDVWINSVSVSFCMTVPDLKNVDNNFV